MAREGLSVAEAAEALGTSPQTVRALLRKGELAGEKREWGSRYVWEVSQQGLDEFVATYGRIDGQRRQTRPTSAPDADADADTFNAFFEPGPPARKPFVLRPRGRATVFVIIFGLPLLAIYTAARVLPEALWFQELRQGDVYARTVTAQLELYLLVAIPTAAFIGTNLTLALLRTDIIRRRVGILVVVAVSLVAGSLFGSAVHQHWQVYLLWRHRQPFGEVDPMHGKDVGFFVFTLPFEQLVSVVLLSMVALGIVSVTVAHLLRGTLRLRPVRASFGAQVHLACLAALMLVLVAWRLRLRQFELALGQPSATDSRSFAGAGYVDVQVRSPGYAILAMLVLLLGGVLLAVPFVARNGGIRRATWSVSVPAALLVVTASLIGGLVPALVQRLVVDPNPLLSEEPYLARSIDGTRAGLGLDEIDVQAYTPTRRFSAADFPYIRKRVANVPVWDAWVLEARMRQLVTDAPFYRPGTATVDVARVDGRRIPTVVSARQLDLGQLPDSSETWRNDRLAFTHGLGRVEFSGMDIAENREPRLLDSGLQLREPRIYFGDFPEEEAPAQTHHASALLTPTTDARLADSPWVLANTRRPEVDVPTADGVPRASYHYDGTGGIRLTGWVRRAAFAFALGSKEMLLSDDLTPDSRLLLHRDVHDRLATLAPFVQWDSDALPLTANGRIVFVVDGYTTSQNYPYAEQTDLGDSRVSYARASVRATVDAFSGRVDLYLAEEPDPIARAWAEIFPDLFRPGDEFPASFRDRVRYPMDLFGAQATAYERFHVTAPDLFASEADAWSRPIALSGPIDVAGDVDFDESDEDDLRLTLEPYYLYAPPPGENQRRLLARTYYTPRRAQNLVASMNAWIDPDGRPRLVAQNLPRDPVTLGPAQMSRVAFATKRVGNLLGVRNLEIRDLARSSLDTVLLGRPRVLFLPVGVLQIQSLYEGSKGPGAARLIGVTAYLNGRVGLGPDNESAVRQALNEPPLITLLQPRGPAVVGQPVRLRFRVENAKRQRMTITSAAGRETAIRRIATGRGTVEWVPTRPGAARVRVDVAGLDGTRISDSLTFGVMSPAPRVRWIDAPRRAQVGQPVHIRFGVANGRTALARVSTRSGIVLTREYLVRGRPPVLSWTPRTAGRAVLLIRVQGAQGQVTEAKRRLTIRPRPPVVPPPTVALLRAPATLSVGRETAFAFRADSCLTAEARIESPAGDISTWQFACPARRAAFAWTPPEAGRYQLTVTATGSAASAQVATTLTVEEP